MKRRSVLATVALAFCTASAWSQPQDTQPAGKPGQTSPPGGHMEHRFDNPEQYAKSFDDPARDEWQMPGRVIETLALAPGQVVADIGAGTGYFTVRLARAAARPKVYAVDIEKSMVEYVQQRAAKEGLKHVFAVQSSTDGASLPEPVDVVLIVDTYHHIPNRPAYFRELRRSMKPSGRLAIIDFRKGAPSGPPEHFRFTPDQISEELKEAGFRLMAQHDFLPRQLFLVYTF
jgi:ubiquinone/menaquinone biosynthesis C-methylase UbiE